MPLRLHRDLDMVRSSEIDGFGVTSVDMTKNTHARVAGEDTLKPAFSIIGPVRDYNHPSVLRETDANTSAVVNRNPGCACRGVNQRVKQRPVCDRVAAVEHSFSFAIG